MNINIEGNLIKGDFKVYDLSLKQVNLGTIPNKCYVIGEPNSINDVYELSYLTNDYNVPLYDYITKGKQVVMFFTDTLKDYRDWVENYERIADENI